MNEVHHNYYYYKWKYVQHYFKSVEKTAKEEICCEAVDNKSYILLVFLFALQFFFRFLLLSTWNQNTSDQKVDFSCFWVKHNEPFKRFTGQHDVIIPFVDFQNPEDFQNQKSLLHLMLNQIYKERGTNSSYM